MEAWATRTDGSTKLYKGCLRQTNNGVEPHILTLQKFLLDRCTLISERKKVELRSYA